MTFENPAALFWLIPLLGTIIVLYLLRMRRRDVRVPAIFLWPKLTADVRANAPFQKLRFSWLLLVQLLIVALVVAALADPQHRVRGLTGRATVIVVDASASMGATDVAPTRFDAARRKADALVGSMGADDRCALIEAGAQTRVLAPLTGDRSRLREALRGMRVTDSANDMGEALRLASAIAGSRAGGRIVAFSDGSFPPIRDFSPGRSQVIFSPVGVHGRNMAITALDTATAPNGQKQLYAGIHNESTSTMTATYSALADGNLIDSKAITVAAGQTIGETDLLPPGAVKAEARIDAPGDILAADNRAAIYVQGAGTIRVLLVTGGDLFLERALALEPSLRVDKSTAVPPDDLAGSSGPGDYDVVIFDAVPPVPVKAPAAVSFGEPSTDFGVRDLGLDLHPSFAGVKRDDPLLAHVDFTDTAIEKAHRVALLAGGRSLADGPSGPLIVASDRGGHKRLYFGFNLLDSDFPLRVGFPIFIDNLVEWLSGSGLAHGGGITAHAGQPFQVAAPGSPKTVTLTAPDGTKTPLDASTGLVTIRDDDQVGDYLLSGPGIHLPIAVNLLDDAESDVHPRQTLDLPGQTVAAHGLALILADLWRPLAVVALCLLALEWWIFVRKS